MSEILIVDDVAENLHVLRKILVTEGYKVRAATSGEQAIQGMLTNTPDMVLMDINMPEMSGIEACREIKSHPALSGIPILFVSAHSEIDFVVDALNAGGVDYIYKPYRSEEVTARVKTHLNLAKSHQAMVNREVVASIGEMVSGVAHELNTPLGVATTASSHLSDLLQTVIRSSQNQTLTGKELNEFFKAAESSLEMSSRNIATASKQVDAFKTVAVDQLEHRVRAVKLNHYLMQCASLLRPKLEEQNIEMEVFSGEDEIDIDPSPIFQIVSTLLTNSIHHAFENIFERVVNLNVSIEDQELCMEYWDNGNGVCTDVLTNLFKPFFTTKKGSTRHIGLSASVLYTLVTINLHGTLFASSGDRGLYYDIRIPISSLS